MHKSIQPYSHSFIHSYIHALILFSFFLFPFSLTFSQSLTGPSGLFTIPTAEVLENGEVAISVNFLDKKYIEYGNYERDILVGSASISFLPFLEIIIRGTRRLNIPDTDDHVMDRFIGLKLKIIDEGKYIPTITLGLNNPMNTDPIANHFNSSYIVATKNISSNILFDNISLTLGYGSDFIDATDYQFIGIFCGASFDINLNQSRESSISLMIEYDADRLNGGVRLKLFDHINILAGIMGFDRWSGGVSVGFKL